MAQPHYAALALGLTLVYTAYPVSSIGICLAKLGRFARQIPIDETDMLYRDHNMMPSKHVLMVSKLQPDWYLSHVMNAAHDIDHSWKTSYNVYSWAQNTSMLTHR